MKKFNTKFWLSAITALFIVLYISGCEDEDVSVEGFCPEVVLTNPEDLQVNVPLNQVVTVTFNTEMNPETINGFTLGIAPPILDQSNPSAFRSLAIADLSGVITYNNKIATFTPSSSLDENVTYTGTIGRDVEDVQGNKMQEDFVWSFTTGASNVNIIPIVISTDPEDEEIDVAVDIQITAQFSEEMDPLTITDQTFTLFLDTDQISVDVSYTDSTATYTPLLELAGGIYTATITTGAENLEGIALAADYVWTFTVLPNRFTLIVNAENGDVAIDPEEVDYLDGDEVILTATADPGWSFDSWDGDATGNDNPLTVVMDANKEITAIFTENPPAGPGAVDLGTAGDFVILTKTGISTTGTTLITGNIGVTPATSTAITGFSETLDASTEFATSDYVVGRIYAADYGPPTPTYVSTAMSDQENAFTTAMGMVTDVINELGAGDISGMTLAPGLYKWTTGLLITNQGVTLSGGPNDTWVFQIADDFTLSENANITLSGGANVDNIFWITSTQALIGSNVQFRGNLLAQTLISLTAGSSVDGRLLSQSQVTLDSNTITIPE